MFIFTKIAEKALNKIDSVNRESILYKLRQIKVGKLEGDISKLHKFGEASHRLRIGDYRLILKKIEDGYIILDVGHRQSIYR